MYQYLSKTEDCCLQAMKQVRRETFKNNNMRHHETLKIIVKAYLKGTQLDRMKP